MGAFSAIKYIAIFAIIFLVAGGIYYVTELKADLATSQANEQKLKDAVEVQQKLVESMQRDIQEIQVANQELTDQARAASQKVKDLENKFNVDATGKSRDFGALAAAKPGLIERLINRGSASALRCLELATGAAHTEKELNATKSSEINRECPEIANPNYIPVTP